MFAYLGLGAYPIEPLDYRFLSLIQDGLAAGHADHPRDHHPKAESLVQSYTWHVGKLWWGPLSPIYGSQDRTTLHHIYTSAIMWDLDFWKYGNLSLAGNQIKTPFELAVLGMNVFIRTLARDSGIPYHMAQDAKTIRVEIIDCPFCTDNSKHCRVFLGVMEALIRWLHGTGEYHHATLSVNEDESTGHHIVLSGS